MKYSIAPAASGYTQCDLSRNHVTTLDFGQILPIAVDECIIGDRHHVEISPFVRLAPMAVPTFGNFDLHLVSFFVPFYTINPYFDNFVTGQAIFGGIGTGNPRIRVDEFYNRLAASDSSQVKATAPDFYDFCLLGGTSKVLNYVVLNRKNRVVYKIMQMLGYPANSIDTTNYDLHLSNALCVLCFIKAFNDWLSLASNYSNSIVSSFLASVRSNPSGTINSSSLVSVLQAIAPLIGSDFFTSAYNGAVSAFASPTNGSGTAMPLGFFDVLRGTITADNTVTNTDNDVNVNVSSGKLNSFSLNFLKSFDAFVRRNELAGTRPAQRILARFGIKSEDYRSNYAKLIDHTKIPFNVADVTATAANADPALGLGTYAGQSVASGTFKFDFDCEDYGMLFTFAYIDARAMYKAPTFACNLRKEALDYYQPEFDGVGMSPVSYSQLHSNPRAQVSGSYAPSNRNRVFGFVPRYEEYRTSFDLVTGDFISFDTMDAWHFGRDLTVLRQGDSPVLLPQSNEFQQIGQEFDRIFTTDVTNSSGDDTAYDHFFAVFNIKMNSERKMKSRPGSVNFKDGEIAISSLGKTLNGVD